MWGVSLAQTGNPVAHTRQRDCQCPDVHCCSLHALLQHCPRPPQLWCFPPARVPMQPLLE
eukprot:3940776-Rhodomonas_salina.2